MTLARCGIAVLVVAASFAGPVAAQTPPVTTTAIVSLSGLAAVRPGLGVPLLDAALRGPGPLGALGEVPPACRPLAGRLAAAERDLARLGSSGGTRYLRAATEPVLVTRRRSADEVRLAAAQQRVEVARARYQACLTPVQ